jgi:hypothetical protein
MSTSVLMLIIGLGGLVFLAVFLALQKYHIRLHVTSRQISATPLQGGEAFYCLRANVRQVAPHFYIAHMIFSNKKNLPLDTLGAPTRHSDQEHNN